MGASLADLEFARELRQRYRQAREATLPAFRTAFKEAAPGEDPDDVADELLAVVDGLTVGALTDPERYPPSRQLALLHRTVERLGLPTGKSR
jgi:hypothetical protein